MARRNTTRADQVARQQAAQQQSAQPQQPAPQPQPTPVAPAAKEKEIFVIDLTATPDRRNPDGTLAAPGHRQHEMIVRGQTRVITFEHGKPTKLPWTLAMQFLQHHDSFRMTDQDGNEVDWRPPETKAPDAAQMRLEDDQVVARLDELSTDALRIRCAIVPGGDEIVSSNSATRDSMIDFLTRFAEEDRKSRLEPDTLAGGGGDDMIGGMFTPPAENDDGDDFFPMNA